jgi:acyl-CoA reductase-like NAD-dependent aldehyde dehydrogenase
VDLLRCISPIDGSLLAERPGAGSAQVADALARAGRAQTDWARRPRSERAERCLGMVEAFEAQREAIAREITLQMGRPLAHSPGEVGGFAERARAMIGLAEEALAEVVPEPRPGFRRFVRREPLGVVLTIAPWNYPYLTAVNSIVPALMAGNAVLLRHSAQTLLCGERIAEAFAAAELPEGVFQVLHLGHAATERLVASEGVDFVAFTGSVGVGRRVQYAARERFIGVGLELGGKDPAYVRADADLAHAAENLAEGAFFNAGQSCCGIERIYVAAAVFDEFVERLADEARRLRLGNPLEPESTLGPLVRADAAEFVRGQVSEAVAAGARALLDPAEFAADEPGSAYLAPQVLVDVDQRMRVMSEESFGPIVGVMPVRDDAQAIALMNDSAYGLTACVWTRDEEAALHIGAQVETGTFFMNRCDYLDPYLAWTGVKDSGRGCTLSRLGYESLTRPKSFHLRLPAG